jgi:hypothetical protein
MSQVSAETSIEQIAALISTALEEAGVEAILSGGGAVTLYSSSQYMSKDLDFVTSERNSKIVPILEPFGFELQGRQFIHPEARYFIEFPPGPLAFGDRYVEGSETTLLKTDWGNIRIITPTQSVMDRITWFVHGNDAQSRAQAILVARHQEINWEAIYEWAENDGIDVSVIEAIERQAASS